MVVITYDTLALLWEDLANAMSGRTSGIFDPPIRTTAWALTQPTIDGEEVVVVAGTSQGSKELRAPKPPNTLAGFAAFVNDPAARRTVICSREPGGNDATRAYDLITNPDFGMRKRLLDAVWPGHIRRQMIGDEGVDSPRLMVQMSYTLFGWWDSDTTFTESAAGWPHYKDTYWGSQPSVLDLCLAIDALGFHRQYTTVDAWGVEHPSEYGIPITGASWPGNPDQLEDWASLAQFAGRGDAINADELAALDELAVRLAAHGAARGGRVKDGQDRTLVKLSGRTETLPSKGWTTAHVLRRLAAGVRAAFGAGLRLYNYRGNAIDTELNCAVEAGRRR